jgi:group I intron endonuclease
LYFFFGKTRSAETKVLMSEAKKGENHSLFGKTHSAETKAKMSKAKEGGIIYVYDSQGTLANSFSSARNATDYFNCDHKTIMKYVKNEKIFKKQWILSTSLITKR